MKKIARYLILTALLSSAAGAGATEPCGKILARVLVNAQAFGFGPAAAMAEFFPHLRGRLGKLVYIGKGHTLDLHGRLPYDAVIDCGGCDSREEKRRFLETAKDFDVFITAMDFEAAQWAREAGLKVIFYDALAWYWEEIPAAARGADLYLAQNFLGVERRIAENPERFPHAIVVPPVVSSPPESLETENALLVNLGGLSNPFISDDELAGYARAMIAGVREAVGKDFDKRAFLSGTAIARRLEGDIPIVTAQPREAQELLGKSRLAVMTPGLGNIYEAAALGKKVIWLPPTNASQGQQARLLEKNGLSDAAIDWEDLLDIEPIDYFGPQEESLRRIAGCLAELAKNPAAREKLIVRLRDLHAKLEKQEGAPLLEKLGRRFGSGGAAMAAKYIVDFLDEPLRKSQGAR